MSTLLASDDFNRADAADLGANWTIDEGTIGVVSNEARGTTNFSCRARYTAGSQPPDDQRSGALISVYVGAGANSGTLAGPGVRMDAANHGYFALVLFDNGVYFNSITLRKDAYNGTLLGTYTGAFTIGDRIELKAVGDQLTVYRNGSAIIGPVTDTTYTSGRCGLMLPRFFSINYHSGEADDWEQWDDRPFTNYIDAEIAHQNRLSAIYDAAIAHQTRLWQYFDGVLAHEGWLLNWVVFNQEIAHQARAAQAHDAIIAHQNRLNLINATFDQAIAHHARLAQIIDAIIAHQNSLSDGWAKEAAQADSWAKELAQLDSWAKEAGLPDLWSKS